MITLTRLEARRLRDLFRRRTLGAPSRGPAPPVVLTSQIGTGLLVRWSDARLGVESILAGGRSSTAGSIALPLDALADLEGRDATEITLDSLGPGRVVARWDDHGIPRSREYDVPADLPVFPEPPSRFHRQPTSLVEALVQAAEVAGDDSVRYALGSIELRGDSGTIVATDGHQLLVHGGFTFAWNDAVLVHPTPIFTCRDLCSDPTVTLGRTDTHVVLRLGPVTVGLAIRTGVRFPRTDGIVPSPGTRSTRLRLDPDDARFLADNLARLPGGDEPSAPITLDLNGVIAVRSRPNGNDRPTELVLAHSRYSGDPIRIASDRDYLTRALSLGLRELDIPGPNAAISSRDATLTYAWQPLSSDSAIAPSDDTVRIVSSSNRAPRTSSPRSPRVSLPTPTPDPALDPPSTTPTSLLDEAEALHAALTDAKARSGRLVVALRRQRRSNRLVAETLRTLEGLREIAG